MRHLQQFISGHKMIMAQNDNGTKTIRIITIIMVYAVKSGQYVCVFGVEMEHRDCVFVRIVFGARVLLHDSVERGVYQRRRVGGNEPPAHEAEGKK